MFRRVIQSGYLTLLLCIVYGLVMAFLAPGFASTANAANVLDAMLPLMIVATGQTIVLITAGIDLSVTSIIALTSITGAAIVTGDNGWMANSSFATPVALAAMLVVGCAVGFINGGCVAWLKMPPFIVTLTSMMFFSGFSIWLTESEAIYNLPPGFKMIGKNIWIATAVTVIVALMAQLLLSRTLLGSRMRSVGQSESAAKVSGIPVSRVTLLAYVICGGCAGIASILITGQLETGSPVQWENNLLDVIGATVIGGTSLFGGRGSVAWTFCGVLLLTLIDNSLNLMNLSHFTIMMSKGGVILLAAFLDTIRNRRGNQ